MKRLVLFSSAALFFARMPAAWCFGVGIEYGQYGIRYNEDLTLPQKSSESGTLQSVHVTAHQTSGAFEFNERVGLAWAGITYGGSLLVEPYSPVTFAHDDKFKFAEVEIGYRVSPSFELYSGAHYREWFRDLSAYQETYRWFMVPLGLRWNLSLGTNTSLTFDLAVRPTVFARLGVHYVTGSVDDDTLPMGIGVGGRVALPLAYHFSGASLESSLVLTPWYQMVNNSEGSFVLRTSGGVPIADADGSAQYAVEPASTTHEFGLRLGLVLGFD